MIHLSTVIMMVFQTWKKWKEGTHPNNHSEHPSLL